MGDIIPVSEYLAGQKKPKVKKAKGIPKITILRELVVPQGVSEFIVLGSLPSLNELVDRHYSVKTKFRNSIEYQLMQYPGYRHPGKVKLEIFRYACRFQDDENGRSAFKNVIDAIRNRGIIVDDSPKYIQQPVHFEQFKCKKKKGQYNIIRFTDVNENESNF